MKNTLYKLLILGHSWELYKIAYNDIISKNVIYIDGFFPKNIFLKILYKVHLTPKLNRFVKLPFKIYWNNLFFRGIKKDERFVVLVFQYWLSVDGTIKTLDYLRRYKNCKIIGFFQDITSSFKDLYTGQPININYYKDKFDLIISYDKKEAQKYGFLYHPTVFSHKDISRNNKPFCDVFFIGKYKGRLSLLIDIYRKLTASGLNCHFIVLNVPKEKQLIPDCIHYTSQSIAYEEVLEYVSNAKCLLEILQPGAVGYTYRTWEAISYNKRLLTNNLSLKNSHFYDEKYISIFSEANDIDLGFFKSLNIPPFNINPYTNEISPINLIRFIEKKMGINISL